MFLFCWSLSLHTFCALVGFSAPRLTPRDGAEQGEPRSEEEQRAEATSARSPASATNNHSNAGEARPGQQAKLLIDYHFTRYELM